MNAETFGQLLRSVPACTQHTEDRLLERVNWTPAELRRR